MSTPQEFAPLWSTYLTVAIIVFAMIVAAIGYALLRRRSTVAASALANHPRAFRNLEFLWVALVAATVIVLVAFSFRTGDRVDALSTDQPSATIKVTAFQWGWSFAYENGARVIGDSDYPPTLAVPTGVPVRFLLTSRDVIHSFWIPDLRFKRDAFPNRSTDFELVFSASDVGPGECAEFCGLDHSRMDFRVLPLDPPHFALWLTRAARRGIIR